MPELPEVEAVCRHLRQTEGRRIVGARVMRCATPVVKRRAVGRTISGVERRGKHILLRLDGGLTLHVHLRMSGELFVVPKGGLDPVRARVVLELDNGTALVLEDGRALARMDLPRSDELDAKLDRELGPEPLSESFTADYLVAAARRGRQAAKLFLMDQRKVAGLGNIYAAEVLYRARISPRKRLQTLSRKKLTRLHSTIVTVLEDAVQSAWIAYSGPGVFAEAETFPCAVYGREGEVCCVCGKAIRRIPQGGRSTYYCPGCQA